MRKGTCNTATITRPLMATATGSTHTMQHKMEILHTMRTTKFMISHTMETVSRELDNQYFYPSENIHF